MESRVMESPETLPTQQPKIGEDGLMEHVGIEMVTANDVVTRKKKVELEAFMHEKVVIRISPEKGIPVTVPVTLNVSGVPQHVFRGVATPVSRKFVEALQRATTTDYEQDEMEMMQGERPRAIATPAHAFTVLKDTEKGKAWLADLQNQMV
jgi:DNA-binding cell septation regulator SpoVG